MQETFEYAFDVPAHAQLEIRNVRGDIQVLPGPSGQIRVKAVKHVAGLYPERTRVQIDQLPDKTVRAITEKEPRLSFIPFQDTPCRVDYFIEAPADCSVSLSSVACDSSVEGLQGDFSLRTVSGRLRASGLTGSATIKSVSGKVVVAASNLSELQCSTVSGSATVHTPLGDGPYRLKSVSGKLRLVIPMGTPCTVHAKSVSGQLKTSLPATLLERGRRTWRADLNGGGVEVKMSTVSGNMLLVTNEDETAREPSIHRQTREDRLAILNRLDSGDLSVDDALSALK